MGINKLSIGLIYFDSGNLYFACSKDKLPVVIKNIREETTKQIGEFFHCYGLYPERAATRMDFNNDYVNLQLKIDKTYLYIISAKISLEFYPFGVIEFKKVGNWLKKYKINNEVTNEE